MWKIKLVFLLFFTAASAQQHCGYDFTSYIVLHVHEDGKKENVSGLTITLIDSSGTDAVNTGNKYSWKNANEVLKFYENYPIDENGKRATAGASSDKLRWYFPFAKDTYILSVTNEFPADAMSVKIEDPSGLFQTQVVPLFAFNMYILCSTQAQQQAMQFGRRTNKPIDIILKGK